MITFARNNRWNMLKNCSPGKITKIVVRLQAYGHALHHKETRYIGETGNCPWVYGKTEWWNTGWNIGGTKIANRCF